MGPPARRLPACFCCLPFFFAVGMGMDVRLRAPEVVRYARGSLAAP